MTEITVLMFSFSLLFLFAVIIDSKFFLEKRTRMYLDKMRLESSEQSNECSWKWFPPKDIHEAIMDREIAKRNKGKQ